MSIFNWLKGKKQSALLFKKSDDAAMMEATNPLRGMTERALQDVFDYSRRGSYARLQWIYNEIECADPTLLTVAERRDSAAGDCDFRITSPDGRRVDGFDETLAAEQREALEYAYGRCERSLPGLASHLCGAYFRGYAHARPVFDGLHLTGFEHLDQWNFCRDTLTGEWYWNPSASDGAECTIIPPGELITLGSRRHIDYPALAIYIRLALGERKYGIWLERYGIPPVTVIMPEFADTDDVSSYFEAADRMSRAGGGALPYGSIVNYANEARGSNPFEPFLLHQRELIVTMATGGTLTTLASPTGIGGGASDVQDKVWRSIVRRDNRSAGDVIDGALSARLLAPHFPGRPVLARFEFATEESPTATEVFEEAAAARQAGYTVDQAELEQETGWKLAPYEITPAAIQQPLYNTAVLNKAEPAAAPISEPSALASDLEPLAARLAAALDLPDAEMPAALQALLKDAPDLFRQIDESGLFTSELETKLAHAFAAGFNPESPSSSGSLAARSSTKGATAQ